VTEKGEKFKRAILWIPAKLYELAVRVRVVAYETRYLKSKRLNSIVISIGNVTHGGTGKTPMVEYIARYLGEEGYRAVILTRGFSRRSRGRRALNVSGSSPESAKAFEEYGDEPLMLARALPEVPVIIDSNRYEAGLWAEREIKPDVLILDDGFQHLALERDLNILLLDATDPFGGFEMSPFGRLREPLFALRRADAVIITRADHPLDQAQTLAIIRYFCGEKVPVMYVYSTISHLRHLASNEIYEAKEFAGWNVSVLSGIGNPRAFSRDILQTGMGIVSEHFFADHHAFTEQEVRDVMAAAREAGADAIVTTEKDAVRLEGFSLGDIPVYAARLMIQSEDEVRLKSLLLRAMIRRP
jgi:tetraacyldisaccharide 4'-kinase